MIVREQPSALQLFITMQGSIIPKIIGKIIGVSLVTLTVMLIDRFLIGLPHISIAAMGVFGIALSLFLGFRNNAAYERWWEARKLWGNMIADTRNLARELQLFQCSENDRKYIMDSIAAFAHLHRGNLRETDTGEDVEKWVGSNLAATLATYSNPADAALREIADHLGKLADSEKISNFGRLAASKTLASLSASQAGCERIATTPLPFVYSLLVRRTTYLYCWLLPFALIESTSFFAPIFAAVVAYVFFGLQAVTNELEMPFQNVENGLPLDAMCRTIEISVAEALGETAPEPMFAKDHVLT